MKMPLLGVNIDHIATLRQVRKGTEPEPVFAALMVESAGADSIVVHLREDRRHIQDRDVTLLRKVVKTKLNLEMSIASEIVNIAVKVRPDQATLVPERRQELTTEGGLNVAANVKNIRAVVRRLEKAGIDASLFIDPDKKQVDAALKTGVKMVELHTGRYADAVNSRLRESCFREIENVANYAKSKKLRVFAGHGLNYNNVSRVAELKNIEELNIGYSIICRAVLVGLSNAVKEMKALIK